MKKIIFIHGYRSSPEKTKYQLIVQKLRALGIDYSIPQMPGGEHPHSSEWLEIIDKEVKSSDKPVVLVGHSLGTRAILLYLDKYKTKVDTVVLIAALNNDYRKNGKRADGKYNDFFDYPVDTDKIKKLADKFIVMHSKDDDLLDYQEHGVRIAEELDAKLITKEDCGHFRGEENAQRNASLFVELVKSL